MKLWIDGHNLIAALPDLSLEAPDDEAQLVVRLQRFAWRRPKDKLTVFFDHGRGGPAPMPHAPEVKTHFASQGRTADDLIRAALDETPPGLVQGVTVVTSDRALANAARASGARVQSSQDFAARLEKVTAQPTVHGPDEAERPTPLPPTDSEALLREFEARRHQRSTPPVGQGAASEAKPPSGASPSTRAASDRPAAPPEQPAAPAQSAPQPRKAARRPEPTLASQDAELLSQFESRYSQRSDARESQSDADAVHEALLQRLEARRLAREAEARGGTDEASAAPEPKSTLSPEDQELLRLLEAHQKAREAEPRPEAPPLPRGPHTRPPNQSKPSDEASLLQEFEARYRARKRAGGGEPPHKK